MSAPAIPIDALRRGDRRAIARAISALENDTAAAHPLRAALAAQVGRAHVIGVTGPPGGGKSTLVAALIKALRAQALTVAVVAVDPSSPITGGAVLGDRVRMGEQQGDEGVFIRSLASRGQLGGLSRAAGDAVDVFDAAGFDCVIVETVGAGQSEVAVTRLADTRLVVCPPGLGDDIQALKAGVLEIADAFVVSKADLPGAQRTVGELKAMLALRRECSGLPPVFEVSATAGTGVETLAAWLVQRTPRGTRHGSAEDRAVHRMVERALHADAYARHLGFELVSAATGSATVRLRVGPEHINFNGRCHGGAIFSLADTALGLACNSYGTVAALVAANISISVGVEEGQWLLAQAIEVSRTRKLAVYRVDVSRVGDGAHIASLSGTVYRSDKPLQL